MALARSASGPGGLSINTGSANLFGSATPTQAPAGGGLFGTTPAKPAGLFGGATTTPAAGTAATTPAGGLFGQAKPASATPTGGLFGASTATPAATAAAAPAAQGSLGTAAGGSLFGGAPAATAATATTATTATTAAGTGGGLFGAAAPATGATGGLFGSTAVPAPAATAPAFGSLKSGMLASTQQATTTPLAAATASTIPGVRIDLGNLKGTTRFNDLHENLQRDIIAFDTLIQGFIEQKNQVDAFLPAHAESLESIPGDVRFVGRKYDGVSAALGTDLQAIQVLRETVKQDAEHSQLSFQALDNQKLPAQFHTSGLWSAAAGDGRAGGKDDPRAGHGSDSATTATATAAATTGSTDLINFFSRRGDDIGRQLQKLEKNLGEIEVHMYGVQSGLLEQLQRVAARNAGGGGGGGGSGATRALGGGDGVGLDGAGASSADEKVAELAAVLRDFEDSILTVASVVGSAREDMTALQLGRYLGGR